MKYKLHEGLMARYSEYLNSETMKDIPEYKKPKDVVITFKRCSTCSSVYDITQLVAFVLFSYFVVAYKSKIIRLLSR